MLKKTLLFAIVLTLITIGCNNNPKPARNVKNDNTPAKPEEVKEPVASPQIDPTVIKTEGKTIVAGVVKSVEGDSIKDAAVSIGINKTKTNEAGAYRLDIPENSFPVKLKVVADGYAGYEVELGKKEYYDNIEVLLKPNVIEGSVFEKPHEEYAAVKYMRIPSSYIQGMKIEVGHKTTDGEVKKTVTPETNGRFKLFGMPLGPGWIKITSPYFATYTQAISVRTHDFNIEVILRPNMLTAKVLDGEASGVAIKDASVNIDGEEVITNIAGDAYFNHISIGEHEIEIKAEGFKTHKGKVAIEKNLDNKEFPLKK